MKKSTIARALSALTAAALVSCLAGCGTQAEEAQEQAPEPEAAPEIGIKLDITAEGWTADTSTPVIALLTPVAAEEEVPEAAGDAAEGAAAEAAAAEEAAPETVYREVSANEEAVIELEAGEYGLGLISPINADGSIYTVPDDAQVTAAEITDDSEAIALELIPADQVQTAQLEGIVSALTVASQTDPEAVPAATLERAKANALANPNANAEKIEAAEDAAAQAVASGDKAAVEAAAASRPTASAPAGSAPSAPAASGSANAGQSQTPAASQTPAHTHSFDIPVYSQEQYLVSEGSSVCVCSCGVSGSLAQVQAHIQSCIDQDIYSGHSYSVQSTPPQYGYRDVFAGYYQCSCGASQNG